MSPTTARRAHKALRLRDEVVTFRHIGAELGCSHVRAHQLVDLAIREMLTGPAYAQQEAQLRRLNALSKTLWEIIRTPHYVVAGVAVTPADVSPRLLQSGNHRGADLVHLHRFC